MNSPITSPSAPTIIRITPTVWMSTPATVAVTAYFRIAPTAMRKIDVPIVKVLLLLRGWTDDAIVAEAADLRGGGRLEVLLEDAARDLRHRRLDPIELLLRVLDRDLLARQHVEVALR